jgi:HSP20 family protein
MAGGRVVGRSKYFDWSPTADIGETDTKYLIRASLPAVKNDDVKVIREDGVLTLSGERRQEGQQKDELWW